MRRGTSPLVLAALLLLALAGCVVPPPAPGPTPPPVPPPAPVAPPPAPVAPPPAPIPVPTASERALTEGIRLYDAGEFNGAIKQLGTKEIWDDSTTAGVTANKLAAHKYIAFSYCVTSRRTQCRQQFVDALKLDSNFNLDPAEKTHPIWGPEFDRAKKQASSPPPPPPPPAKRPATAPPANPPKTQ